MSDYFIENQTKVAFSTDESWVILSSIEQSIKRKIEEIGTPLKDWDINIYRGILTGYNEAFIISGEKRAELLASCDTEEERVRTDELIRPILRGRDIKRYNYDYADLWLINTHNGIKEKGVSRIKIDDYPAVKLHLDQYWDQIAVRADKGDTPYNLRNCAYMDDFSKQKIVWADLSRSGNSFAFDCNGVIVLNTSYILTRPNDTGYVLQYLLGILNSRLTMFYINLISSKLDDTGWRWFKQFVELVPIPNVKSETIENIASLVCVLIASGRSLEIESQINGVIYQILQFTEEEIKVIEGN